MIALSIGMVLASLSITYAWWVRIRVINLRQDIYDIRDRLFDKALALESLSDPAYREAREHLNKVAAIVNRLSLMVLAFVLGQGRSEPMGDRFKTSNFELQHAINESLEASSSRLAHYLFRETLTGAFCSLLLIRTRVSDVVEAQLLKWSRRWVYSQSPDEMAAMGMHRDR